MGHAGVMQKAALVMLDAEQEPLPFTALPWLDWLHDISFEIQKYHPTWDEAAASPSQVKSPVATEQ